MLDLFSYWWYVRCPAFSSLYTAEIHTNSLKKKLSTLDHPEERCIGRGNAGTPNLSLHAVRHDEEEIRHVRQSFVIVTSFLHKKMNLMCYF